MTWSASCKRRLPRLGSLNSLARLLGDSASAATLWEAAPSHGLASRVTQPDLPTRDAVAMLSDTHPEAAKVQIELLRKATVAERFSKVRSLTARSVRLSKRAISRANPGLTPEELRLRFIELHYGKDLAERVRVYLQNR